MQFSDVLDLKEHMLKNTECKPYMVPLIYNKNWIIFPEFFQIFIKAGENWMKWVAEKSKI